jgi:hypothetical protein
MLCTRRIGMLLEKPEMVGLPFPERLRRCSIGWLGVGAGLVGDFSLGASSRRASEFVVEIVEGSSLRFERSLSGMQFGYNLQVCRQLVSTYLGTSIHLPHTFHIPSPTSFLSVQSPGKYN